MRMDSMCAVTGPYAVEILENRLGAAPGTCVNATPLPDFGGMHPDPNPTWAKALMDEMFGTGAGFRRRVGRRRGPQHGGGAGDLCLAFGQSGGAGGQCASGTRAMPRGVGGGGAVDADLGGGGPGGGCAGDCASIETPTGWKFFGNLLDAGQAPRFVARKVFGTGSDHVREKDGLWAVLLWLNILAVRQAVCG